MTTADGVCRIRATRPGGTVKVSRFILAERSVFSIILILLVVFAVLSLLLAAWTLFFQSYIYSEPIGALYWLSLIHI